MLSSTATNEPEMETYESVDNGQPVESTTQSSSSAASTITDMEGPLTLIPISSSPIMLTSSRPLLSNEECSAVLRYLDYLNWKKSKNDTTISGSVPGDTGTSIAQISQDDIRLGERLIEQLHNQIDELTGCPRHAGELPFPRYITYDPVPLPCQRNEIITRDQLLPDGLHVDSNNGKYFRHITILFYLTTNECGATTFPLASKKVTTQQLGSDSSSSSSEVHYAAQRLIQGNAHHTQMTEKDNKHMIQCAKILEEKALELYQQDNDMFHKKNNDDNDDDDNKGDYFEEYGIRVLPSAGHVCVFCNLDECNGGSADPDSYHGGEMLIGGGDGHDKAVLTFFKEIPMNTFTNREEFAEQVRKRKRYLVDRYF